MTPPRKPALHPACALWPKMSGTELEELSGDIKINGQLDDIFLTPDGQLLEGSNRWDACEKAGVNPRTVIYHGDDPIGFVISKNQHRRHLNKSQLAMIAARLRNLRTKSYQSDAIAQPSQVEVAQQFGISPSAVTNAGTVLRKASPNITMMVEKGEVVLENAIQAIRAEPSKKVQEKWIAQDVKQIGQERRRSQDKQRLVPEHIQVRQYPTNGGSQVRETSAKGFFLVNLYLTKKEVTFLNRALNRESSQTEWEMSARCLIKSLRERNYELTNLNRVQ